MAIAVARISPVARLTSPLFLAPSGYKFGLFEGLLYDPPRPPSRSPTTTTPPRAFIQPTPNPFPLPYSSEKPFSDPTSPKPAASQKKKTPPPIPPTRLFQTFPVVPPPPLSSVQLWTVVFWLETVRGRSRTIVSSGKQFKTDFKINSAAYEAT